MARALANDMPIGDVTNATDAVRNRVLARRAWAKGDLPAALQHWLDQPDPPRNLADRTLLAEAMAAAGHPATLDAIAAIREDQPVAALACEARYYAALGHISPAISKIEEALRAYRQDPWPPDRMMGRALRLADYLSGRNPEARRALFHILEEPFALNLMADERLDLLLKVGLADDGLCAEALAHVEPYTPWREDVLEQRVRCYERTGHPNLGMARADLEEFVASDDSDLIEDAAPTAQESGMAGRGSRRGGGS